MVGLTAAALAPGFGRTGIAQGERTMWLCYDYMLGLAFVATAGDIPFRYGISPALWAMIYTATILRCLTVWPDYLRLLSRNWAYLLYPAVVLASIVWSISRGSSVVGGIQISMSTLIACYLGWRFSPRQLMMMVFLTMLGGSAASLLNMFTGWLGSPRFSLVGGLQGIYANKNTLGHTSLLMVLVAITLRLLPPVTVPAWVRWLAPWAAIMGLYAVVMSKSMTAIVLIPVYLGLLLLLNRKMLAPWVRHIALMVAVLVVALVPVLMALANTDPMTLLFDLTGKDATLTGRTQLWDIASTEIAKSPLIGYGFGAFWDVQQFANQRYQALQAGATTMAFHNVFMDVGIGTGLLGIAAISVLIATSLRRAIRYWRADGGPLGVGCLITVMLPINLALVEPYLYRPHEIMVGWLIMMGVSIGQFRGPFLSERKEST